MRFLLVLFVVVPLLLFSGCAKQVAPPLDGPDRLLESRFTPLDLTEYLQLDQQSRADRSHAADSDFVAVLMHRQELFELQVIEDYAMDIHGNTADFSENPAWEKRVDTLIRKLHRATATDPTFVEAWYILGDLLNLTGDQDRARLCFASGLRARRHDQRECSIDDISGALRVGAAWSCREQGLVEEGLAWLEISEKELGFYSREARLVRGLLLADGGRFREAWKMAMSLKATRYPHRSWMRIGVGTTKSGFERRWVQAMAWLGIGEIENARHALGVLMMTHGDRPHMRRFWNDAGLVCELSGRVEEASNCYGVALVGDRVMLPYLPWEAYSTPPVILQQPDIRIPFYTVYETNYYAGSLFSFATQLMAETANTKDPLARAIIGRDAEQALTVCMRRGIRPVMSQALRGRNRYYLGEMIRAEDDLQQACAELNARGEDDVGSCVVLGVILLNDQRAGEALDYLQRAAKVAPAVAGVWRTLGVTYATLGREEEANDAMTHAIDLEPGNSNGWYNRGLWHAERQCWDEAVVDLEIATRIAPWNQRAMKLLQRSASELRLAGRDEDLAEATKLAASLAAENQAIREGRIEQQPHVIRLSGTPDGARHAVSVTPVDYEARAAKLEQEYGLAPTTAGRRELADAYLKSGRSQDVVLLLTDEWSPTMALEDMLLLLRADRDQGRYERALSLIDNRGSELPEDTRLWSLLALVCLESDHRDQGRQALDHALLLDPDNRGLQMYRTFLGNSNGVAK
jgi:tetratricopeptide (TPR) repeat protein